MANKPILGPADDRLPDGRPARPIVDPAKRTPLGRKPLPQVPSVAPTRLRHTAQPK